MAATVTITTIESTATGSPSTTTFRLTYIPCHTVQTPLSFPWQHTPGLLPYHYVIITLTATSRVTYLSIGVSVNILVPFPVLLDTSIGPLVNTSRVVVTFPSQWPGLLLLPLPWMSLLPVHEYTIKRGYQGDRTWTGYGEFTPSYGP